MEKMFQKMIFFFFCLIFIVFPLFFLIFTQEFYIINKFYLLGFAALLLILISGLKLLVTKKISWQKQPFDSLVLLFLSTMALSTIFSSPNKIQALLNPNFGLLMMVFLVILYFFLSHSKINAWVGQDRPLHL